MSGRILFTAAICVAASASVPETTEMYSCEENTSQTLKSESASKDTDCEQNWNDGHSTIGTFMNGSAECHRPCINLKPGEMNIIGCINASLTVICSQAHVTEYRIHFVGTQTNLSPIKALPGRGHYGIYASLIFMLLLLMVGGLAIHITNTG